MKLYRFQKGSFLKSINVRCGLFLGSKRKTKVFIKYTFISLVLFGFDFTFIKYIITGHSKREIMKRRIKKEEEKEREDSLSRIKIKHFPVLFPWNSSVLVTVTVLWQHVMSKETYGRVHCVLESRGLEFTVARTGSSKHGRQGRKQSPHLELQDYAEGSGMQLFISKPIASDVLRAAKLHLWSLSGEHHQLETKCSKPETMEDVSPPNHPSSSPSTHLHSSGWRKAAPLIPHTSALFWLLLCKNLLLFQFLISSYLISMHLKLWVITPHGSYN